MPRRFSYWLAGVAAAWLGYTVVWTWISLERLYLLRATVFDLGIYSEWGWKVYSVPLSSGQWLGALFNVGGSVFLSPTTLGGYPTILAAQSFALGSGSLLIYLIAARYGLKSPVAFGLAISYLLYFPVSSINFADAHYEAYLIPLFLLGVWLYLRGDFALALLVLLLSGALRYPLSIFPLLFGIQLLVPEVSQSILDRFGSSWRSSGAHPFATSLLGTFSGWRFRRSPATVPRWFVFGLPAISLAFLVGGWLTNDLFAPHHALGDIVHTGSIGLTTNLSAKLETFVLLLLPVGFLPLLSRRWLPLCVPYFALLFFVNYFGYTYPSIVISWYSFLVVPFLYLATIDGVAKLGEGRSWVDALVRRARRPRHEGASTPPSVSGSVESTGTRGQRSPRWQGLRREVVRPPAVAVVLVLVLTIVVAGFLTPYGPWNQGTDVDFRFTDFGHDNRTLYNEFLTLASYIPSSDPAVLMQDNMPELLPRPLYPGALAPFVVGPFERVAYNFTWLAPGGSWSPINPDYVIADPTSSAYNFFDDAGAYPYNLSMEQAISELYATYEYGIVGEASNMLLLKHYYSGPLLYYVPYSARFDASEFVSGVGTDGSSQCGGHCLIVTNQTSRQPAWYGPYSYLSPGTYSVSIHLGLANWDPSDSALIEVTGEFGHLLLNSTLISGMTAGPKMSSIYLNTTVFVGNGTPAIEFIADQSDFRGSLAIYGVSVHEIAPPSPVYRLGNTSRDLAIYHLLGAVPSGSTVLAESALKPYFHNLTLVPVPPSGPVPTAPYELYDPAVPSDCTSLVSNTLCTAVNDSYSSENYSIVAQDDGVTLLVRSSASSTQFAPFVESISASQLFTHGIPGQDFTNLSGTNLTVTNQTNGAYGWYGPYANLPPGTYEAEFELSVSNNSRLNRMELGVINNDGTVLAASEEISGARFPQPDQTVDVNLSATLFAFSSSVEFVGYGVDWSGVVTLHGVGLHEVGPPSPVYRVGDTAHDLAVYRILGLIPNGSSVLAEPALRPYFHHLTLVSVPSTGPAPTAPYEIYDPTFPSACSSPGNHTLCSVVNNSYESGAYSILAQADGVTLLARSPITSLEAYSPFEENFSTSQLLTQGAPGQDFTNRSGSNLTVTNQTNGGYGWYGPYAGLPPGTYEAEFELSVSNNSSLNHMVLRVTGEADRVVLATLNLTGSSFTEVGVLVTVDVSFVLSSFMSNIEFAGSGVDWMGVVTLAGVPLLETAPPG
jgi:uncharacterized membrane protein